MTAKVHSGYFCDWNDGSNVVLTFICKQKQHTVSQASANPRFTNLISRLPRLSSYILILSKIIPDSYEFRMK